MRYALYAGLVVASLVIQTTWLARVKIAGVVPDPLLIVVMAVGLLHGSEDGAVVGAGAGLLQDIVTGVPLGLGMLADLCVGFAAGLGGGLIYTENLWFPAAAAAALSALRTLVWAGTAHLVGLLQAPLVEVAQVGLLTACYNGVIAVPIFRGLVGLDRALLPSPEESL